MKENDIDIWGKDPEADREMLAENSIHLADLFRSLGDSEKERHYKELALEFLKGWKKKK